MSLAHLVIRLCNSVSYRLRRRLRRTELRSTPLAAAGLDNSDTLDLLRALPAPPAVIYDLGANRGQWTLLAKSVFPSASVHAFEPLPDHCAAFSTATGSLAGVQLHVVALGEAEATLEMDLTTFSDSASFLKPTPAMAETYQVQPGRRVRIPVVRLDDWVAGKKLPRPDLIKLDLQGYELHALRGATACLQHASAVLLEVSFREFYAGQATPGTIIAFLEQAGFRLAAFSPDLPAGRRLDQADALFLRGD
ncbi:MAG TPA: FkbM family methyltransferase [Lacunisphaera sp.]|nr:FkbM family methyltransferase [Lacunisphaera sp.]